MSINGLRRRKLHAENPQCHWCKVETILEAPSATHPDLATLDHIFDRVTARELGMSNEERNAKAVLACYRCNQRRGRLGQKSRPENQTWQQRSRR
jgi:5-methylcytosine-specific restriction endonuclease McrA